MPRVTAYVRNEDYPKWKSIKYKTQFLHEALIPLNSLQETEEPVQKIIDKPKVIQNVKEVFGDTIIFCKHGYDPRFCKHAKPGKPCK